MSRTKRDLTVEEAANNAQRFKELVNVILPGDGLFSKSEFHGNIKWDPDQLVVQAIIWAWQGCQNVTDSFIQTQEVCDRIGLRQRALSYTSFMSSLSRYRSVFGRRLRDRFHELAEEIGGRFYRTHGRVLIAFDGSRVTVPRTIVNEKAFCAPNYGHGKEAKYGKKKSKGLRRKRNKEHKTEPPAPQAWVTMMWHMNLRLPWTWRLGPSNSSERGHVQEILEGERFPKGTLFCGDAGFVGYPLWSSIIAMGGDFLIRVGANVDLLKEQVDYNELKDGIVLCWPKDAIRAKLPPLRLRLVQIQIGKTKMWMLTNVLDRKKLTKKQIVKYYKMRWGIEVELRGLKQTLDKSKLRCRNDGRLLAELDWSIRGMAMAELLALREQLSSKLKRPHADAPKNRSLAKTMRALRKCIRNLGSTKSSCTNVYDDLANAVIERYKNRSDKRARYRRRNPDIKPLGDPNVRSLNDIEREKLRNLQRGIAS